MKKIILHNNTPKKEIKKADQIQVTVSYIYTDTRDSLVFDQLASTNRYDCKELSSGPFGGTYLFTKKNNVNLTKKIK